MSDTSPGFFFGQLPSALPGLALIIGTMIVIRLWIEPWMTQTVLFGGRMPDVLSGGFVALAVSMVLWLGQLFKLDRSMTGVMANAPCFNDLHLNH